MSAWFQHMSLLRSLRFFFDGRIYRHVAPTALKRVFQQAVKEPLVNNTTHLSLFISAALFASSAFGAEIQPAPQSTGLPVTLSLDKPGYVTAVIERADGRRVFNLASEVKAQAGPLTLNWDLYDVGVQKGEKEQIGRASCRERV